MAIPLRISRIVVETISSIKLKPRADRTNVLGNSFDSRICTFLPSIDMCEISSVIVAHFLAYPSALLPLIRMAGLVENKVAKLNNLGRHDQFRQQHSALPLHLPASASTTHHLASKKIRVSEH
jgi:hypothetical protein